MQPTELKAILDAVRAQPDLAPRDGKTFCNIALDRILGLYGATRLTDAAGHVLCANDMVDRMRASLRLWTPVSGEVATARASVGTLVVAAQGNPCGHGHVAPVYPAGMEKSGSWGKFVPVLSNVGVKNAILRASQCFAKEPLYYSVHL